MLHFQDFSPISKIAGVRQIRQDVQKTRQTIDKPVCRFMTANWQGVLTSIFCLILALSPGLGCQAVSPATPSTTATGAAASTGSEGATTTSQPDVTTTPGSLTPTPDVIAQATLDRYRVSEVRDYQGMRLDPAIGPRDNSIQGIQNVAIDTYRLRIDGLVQKPVDLTYDEVLRLTPDKRLITLYCVEGWQATILWKGVRIEDLIALAGGETAQAKTVIFHAVDGYTTSLSLNMIKEWDIILAYEANDLPLPPSMGYPFIVVAERKFGYKWARWVNRIELSDNEYYRGYWEDRGFDNNGSIYN